MAFHFPSSAGYSSRPIASHGSSAPGTETERADAVPSEVIPGRRRVFLKGRLPLYPFQIHAIDIIQAHHTAAETSCRTLTSAAAD
jgi:hypothetical protein